MVPVVWFGALRVNGTHIFGEATQATTKQKFCYFASGTSQEQGASKVEFCAACRVQAFSIEYCGQNESNCAGPCGNPGGWYSVPESASQEQVQLVDMSLFWSNAGWTGYIHYMSGVVRTLAQEWRCPVVRAAMGVEENGGYIPDRDAETARIEHSSRLQSRTKSTSLSAIIRITPKNMSSKSNPFSQRWPKRTVLKPMCSRSTKSQ